MSFILDALRKSESERRREAAPSIARAPLAPSRRQPPVWSWLVIVTLSLALVVLSATWWRGRSEEAMPMPMPTVASESPGVLEPSPIFDPAPAREALNALDPRPIGDLAALDPGLPAYTLSFVELDAADATRGSAWINGTRYFPGERIGNGPELFEVRQEGVVLAHRGQRFLLRLR